MWPYVIGAGVCTWAGAALLIEEAIERRGRPSLAERLMEFQARQLTWEAEEWLTGN